MKISTRTLTKVFNVLARIKQYALLARLYHESGEWGKCAYKYTNDGTKRVIDSFSGDGACGTHR